MNRYDAETPKRTLELVKSSERGLTPEEAERRLREVGENVLVEGKKKNLFFLFLSQFKDFMLLLLIAAAILSAVVAYVTADAKELIDTFIIAAIILLNAVIGFVQQIRADKAIEQLKKMSVGHARVCRGGTESEIESVKLVPGDLVDLSEGDVVPADCRILSCDRLLCDESALTGESKNVSKTASPQSVRSNATPGERRNMLFSATYVTGGNARAVVTATGMRTEVGEIAAEIGKAKTPATPLEKGLNKLGRVVSYAVLVLSVVVFLIGFFVRKGDLTDQFMTAVAIAVAAIPEGLTAVVTIIMAMGVKRMSERRVIVRRLHAVETLGGCSCICTDKTGTLTENRMTVERVWTPYGGQTAERRVFETMEYCTTVKRGEDGFFGDPTEVALKRRVESLGIASARVRSVNPFDSERKRMSVAVESADGVRTYVKGAADVLLGRCASIADGDGVRPITDADRRRILAENAAMASEALRILAFAFAEGNVAATETDLTFVGLCGLIDPPREGVREAVENCRTAGIRTVMITGDHGETAFAVAKRLGIASDRSQVVTGETLDRLDKNERARAIENGRVFARVSPKHKLLIVRELQRAGYVVAMTGDGVNDAPAIRSADIGVAMGKQGTEVAKSASDMVIADDDFSTIVTGVKEGRRIFDNIKKTIQFFLATNLAEVLSILAATVCFSRLGFLSSTQLLWINLITDSFPVLALGVERAERNVMRRAPMSASQALFRKRSVASILFYGIAQSLLVIGVFWYGAALADNATASTMAFFVVSFMELFHAYNVRSETGSLFCREFFSNPILHGTVALGIAANLLLAFVPPLSSAFGLAALDPVQWGIVLGASLGVLPIGEIFKFALRTADRLRAKKRCVAIAPLKKTTEVSAVGSKRAVHR